MDSFKQAAETFLTWLLLPATLYGAGGAVFRAIRKGRCWKQVVFEAGGGVLVANMLGPVIAGHAPEQWQYTLYFLVGWGGLEGVGRLYETCVAGLQKRLRVKLEDGSIEPWDGTERRKKPRD